MLMDKWLIFKIFPKCDGSRDLTAVLRIFELGNRFLPEFVFITIALLILLILVGLVGGGTKVSEGGGLVVGIASVLAVIYLAIVILSSVSPTSGLPSFLRDPNFQAIVVVILVLGLVIWYISGDETSKFDLDKWIKTLFGSEKP